MQDNLEDKTPEKHGKGKKITSIIIVFILIIGLSAFGIEGITRFSGGYIIKAGNKKIMPESFEAFLDSQKKEYISRFGSGIIEAFLNKKDFLMTTAGVMADQLLISKFLEDNGIVINKNTINTYINNLPQFQSADGKFDKVFYKDYLSQMGFSESEFIIQQMPFLQTTFFLSLMETISLANIEELAKKIIIAQKQKREVQVIQIPILPSTGQNFEDSEIEAYFGNNKEEFAKNEERIITLAKIDTKSFSRFLQPSKEDLIHQYRKEYLYKDAKVSFQQISFLQKQDADAQLEKLKNKDPGGKNFNEIPLKNLPSEIAEQLLHIQEGEVSPVFYSGGKYNILKLIKVIKKPNMESFENVKSKLIETYKTSKVCSEIEKLASHISEEVESGETLEKALPEGIALENITISSSKKTILPESIQNIIIEDTDTHYAKLLKGVSPCEYYTYKINQIIPKSYKTLEEATPAIKIKIAAFKGKEEALEKTIQKSSNMGKDGKVLTLERAENPLFNEETLEAIFSLKEGGILSSALSKDQKFYLIIKLKKVNNISEKSITAEEVEKMIKTIKESQTEEVLRATLSALRTKYKLIINYKALGGT